MFVNRDEAIEAFTTTLDKLEASEQTPRVLCFTGIIGIGKTHLLSHLYQIARERNAACAIGSQGQKGPVELMAQWSSELAKSGCRLGKFENLLRQYEKQSVRDEDSKKRTITKKQRTQLRQTLTERFGEDELKTLCFDLGVEWDDLEGGSGRAKVMGLIAHFERREHIPELVAAIEELRPDISETVFGIVPGTTDVRQKAILNLTEGFVDGLMQKGQSGIVVMFLDDFENPPLHLERWLRDLAVRTASCKILWVIASWGGLSGDWEQQAIRSHLLLPFSSDSVEGWPETEKRKLDGYLTQFLTQAQVPQQALTPKVLGWAKRQTLGLPYLLNNVSRRLRGEQLPETPSEALVRRMKEWIADEDLFQKAKKCAVARRHLDGDIARALLGADQNLERFWNWLIGTPLLERTFSEDLEEQTRFDPILRTAVLRTIFGDSPQKYEDLHNRLAEYYSSQIRSNFSSRPFHLVCLEAENSLEWPLHLERSYHKLSSSPRLNRWQEIEAAILVLDAEKPNVFGRVYEIIRAFDCVMAERARANLTLGSWRDQLKEVAQIIESSASYTSTGLGKGKPELLSFFERVRDETNIGKAGRKKAEEWTKALTKESTESPVEGESSPQD